MEQQIERERVYKFIGAVTAIRDGRARGVTLSEYWPREIADAIQYLIDGAVQREREACAAVADAAAEPAGFAARGQAFEADPRRREVALDIAASIRGRR
ncbi:MAG TPA: hypothetical protein VFF64_02980 [Candidatus Eremiobacteraceae bacterium]|nr:hypothetical protein [Candidatus Eremiobacteraceae bacterium]